MVTMRLPLRGILPAAFFLTALSCADPVSPDGDVAIATSRDMVFLKNTDDEQPLYSMVIDEDHAALIDLRFCIEDACGMIRPGETRRITAEELGSGPGQVVIVYTWRGVYGVADDFGPGPATMRRVRLINSFPQ